MRKFLAFPFSFAAKILIGFAIAFFAIGLLIRHGYDKSDERLGIIEESLKNFKF